MSLPQVIDSSLKSGSIYETEPVDCAPGTAAFLNTVVTFDWVKPLEPVRLLEALRGIERSLGRPERHPRNAARTIDLDLIFAGDRVMDVPGLTLPHPRAAGRAFVLAPLADLWPDLVLPGETQTVAELLRALPSTPKITPYAPQW